MPVRTAVTYRFDLNVESNFRVGSWSGHDKT